MKEKRLVEVGSGQQKMRRNNVADARQHAAPLANENLDLSETKPTQGAATAPRPCHFSRRPRCPLLQMSAFTGQPRRSAAFARSPSVGELLVVYPTHALSQHTFKPYIHACHEDGICARLAGLCAASISFWTRSVHGVLADPEA